MYNRTAFKKGFALLVNVHHPLEFRYHNYTHSMSYLYVDIMYYYSHIVFMKCTFSNSNHIISILYYMSYDMCYCSHVIPRTGAPSIISYFATCSFSV